LDRRWVDAAWFRDSYRAPLRGADASVAEIFLAVFAHHPKWMKLVLILRNRIASLCGLEAPTMSEMLTPPVRSSYAVGDKIGVWPIFSLTETELIAGRDNKHLDFRVSVLRQAHGTQPSAVVSTVCVVHNTWGKVYLFFIVPFHKWGVRRLLSNAVAEGRL
jgi:hypothetical protein